MVYYCGKTIWVWVISPVVLRLAAWWSIGRFVSLCLSACDVYNETCWGVDYSFGSKG